MIALSVSAWKALRDKIVKCILLLISMLKVLNSAKL